MKTQYEQLKNWIIQKTENEDFIITERDRYTVHCEYIDDEDETFIFTIIWWISNGEYSIYTYEGSDIGIDLWGDNKKELRSRLFDIVTTKEI